MLLFLIHLLTLLPTNFGNPLQHISLSPSQLPSLPSSARKNSLEHASITSMSASFAPFVAKRGQWFKPSLDSPTAPSPSPSPSPASQGELPVPTGSNLPRHHHRTHRVNTHAISPSPSATPGCGQTCVEPLTSAPIGSPCACVFPMKVKLLLGVSLYLIFPEVNDLEIEVAAGTYLKQSQVSIIGASADSHDQERTVVEINLVPLGDKFDNTTAMLTYERFLHKKIPLNRTLFGDYEVLNITYPGIPSSPPSGILSGDGPTGSAGNQQYPITADLVDKNQKMSPRVIFVIALSAFVLLVVCCTTVALLLKCRKADRPSNAVGPVFTSSINKRSGLGSVRSSSPASSTSASLVSTMPASVLSVKTFALTELEKATDKFSSKRILGEGGFGRVYLGIMEDATEVAVKLLTRDNQNGDREFIAEVEMLSRLHHRNLVKLIVLSPTYTVLTRARSLLIGMHGLKIALGAARGLAYLHEDSNPRVIHRDFKASNVLLEDDFTPKVSDFGLAREATEGSHHISTRVMGTFGYVAPEYAMTGHLLVKSDVYSYGVVLLELLSGKKPVDMTQPHGQENLVTWARSLLTSREGLEQLVDPSLAGSYDFDDMAKVAAIASMCVHPEVTHRPFMGEVVQALKLIYNDDTGETCGDACSQKESSARDSDFKGDFAPSDSSWWNAGGITPRLTYGHASSFITMDYSSDHLEVLENRRQYSASVEGGVALPIRHGNRSGPLRTVRSNRSFYRLRGSMSEHGGLLSGHAWNDGTGFEASF
ncbi:Receptor-like serine/threonine-protein kinase ALE2 [Abeliophyllum distichum]|uniref:Receptor-like serine/threonine-protein kinase ALE2 n=1 Tax=Abeliophyllum distichum TaxID=126358 RepID=A0ABD1Q343_9LAMI